MFKNHDPGQTGSTSCGCCGAGVTFSQCVGGTPPCGGSVAKFNDTDPIFGGTLSTTGQQPGGSPASTGSTCCTCIGVGDYVFTLSSSNSHCTVTPGTLTKHSTNSTCSTATFPGASSFVLHWDYWDSPRTAGTSNIGNPQGSICSCPCIMPSSITVTPTNSTGNNATYLKKTSGDCDHAGVSPPVFTSTGYTTGLYTTQALTFQAIPGALPTTSFSAFTIGGSVTLPSYAYYSGSFSFTRIQDESCGSTCNLAKRNPSDPNNLPPAPNAYTGWYMITCSGAGGGFGGGGGLDMYLIERIDGYSYDCHFSLVPTWTATVAWNASRIWSWRDAVATCSPLHIQDGFVTSGTTPSFYMTLTV